MKYLRLAIVTVFTVVSLSACSTKDNPTPVPSSDQPQVKSITSNGTTYATLSYNAKNQLVSFKYAGSNNIGGGGREDKFSYDASGKLLKAVNAVDSTQYSYDANGRLKQHDTFTEWKLSTDGNGFDFRTVYTYNAAGNISAIAVSDGTKQQGQTQRYTVTYGYNADGALSTLTYKYAGDDSEQKFVVEDGYTNNLKINPLILQRVTSIDYYFGVGGIAQLTAKFPKAIKNYVGGQVLEGYGFTFDMANNKVNKITSSLKLPNNESSINYEFGY